MENKEILTESISDLSKENFDTSSIIDNKLCFIVNESLYRVRMPNQGEQAFAENKRALMQLEYLSQPGCITKKQLIKQLKDSGVMDIKKLEENNEILIKELRKLWFILATKDSESKTKIDEYTQEIIKIQDDLKELALEIGMATAPCLESRLEKFYVEFLTNMCTEKRDNDNWTRVWNTLDDFNQADTNLTNKAIASMSWMLLNRKY
jgi:hypothetical protein